MRHTSVLIDEVAEFFRIDAESSAGNSSLGLHSADLVKNHESQTENPSVVDSALAQNLGGNISSLRADSQNLHCKPPIEKTQDLQSGLQETSHSLVLPREQSSLAMTDFNGLPRSRALARNDDSFLDFVDSAPSTNETNSSIVDEFLGLCEASDADKTNGLSRKRAEALPKKSPQDEFVSAPILIDATLGLGGHSERLLDENPTLKIIGIDKDEISLEFAKNRLKRFGARFSAVQGSNARQIKQILRAHKNIYGILADLGISSPQVDNLERGFSIKSSVLDMRMDLGANLDAKFVLNNYPKDELARIFREFGEIRGAEKIANLIAESRRKSPIKSGEDLCKIIQHHIKWRDGIHPATLIFQAIRIEVNNELGDLGEFLANIAHLKGTKVAIISFHSLEDRLVKRAFKAWSAGCVCDEGAMKCVCGGKNERGEIITKKPIVPSAREIATNNRARSAKMRCFKFK